MPSIGIGFTNSGFLKNLQPVFQDFSIQDLGIWLVGLLGLRGNVSEILQDPHQDLWDLQRSFVRG